MFRILVNDPLVVRAQIVQHAQARAAKNGQFPAFDALLVRVRALEEQGAQLVLQR